MTISDVQRATDVVVVGHRPGAGRAVLWRSPGVGKDVEAVRQAAVLPAGRRFAVEPGWLIRQLPSGRWVVLVGGTQHPELRDDLGRGGIFHGVGWIASTEHAMALLGTDDLPGLAIQLAAVGLEGRGRRSSRVDAALECEAVPGPSPTTRSETALDGPAWSDFQRYLRTHGLHAVAGPLDSLKGASAVAGQDAPRATAPAGAFASDGGQAAQRILAAWSGGDPQATLF